MRAKLMVPMPTWSEQGFDATPYDGPLDFELEPDLAESEPQTALTGFDAVSSVLSAVAGTADPIWGGPDERPVPHDPPFADRWTAVVVGAVETPLMFSVSLPWPPGPRTLAHIYKYWVDVAWIGAMTGTEQLRRHRRLTVAHASVLQAAGFEGCVCRLPTQMFRDYLYDMAPLRWRPADEYLSREGTLETA